MVPRVASCLLRGRIRISPFIPLGASRGPWHAACTTGGMMERPRILLAEGDPALRSLLAAALARDGYSVVEAADGTEVLDLRISPP